MAKIKSRWQFKNLKVVGTKKERFKISPLRFIQTAYLLSGGRGITCGLPHPGQSHQGIPYLSLDILTFSLEYLLPQSAQKSSMMG